VTGGESSEADELPTIVVAKTENWYDTPPDKSVNIAVVTLPSTTKGNPIGYGVTVYVIISE
jgi:hypothetical protein